MKNTSSCKFLPWFTLGAGIAGLLLRSRLFAVGVDSRGLLSGTHPANALIFVITGLTMAVLLLCLPAISHRVSPNPPASRISTMGQIVAGLGILAASFGELTWAKDSMVVINAVLGVLAAAGLLLLSWKQLTGQKNRTFEMVVITLYLITHLVCQYRQWSAEPQLQNYLFQLLGSVFLMMACYYRTSLELLGGSLRWFVFFNQGALYFCLLSLNTALWPFYLAMGLWCASDYFTLLQAAGRSQTPPAREE